MGGVQDVGQDAARTVRASRAYQILVKVGLVSYGIVHLLISWVALRLALGERGGAQASNEGALQTMASTPLGAGLMWVVAAGLGMLVVWQLVRILIGFREFEEAKRWRKRTSAVLRALIYGSLAAASASIAVGAQRPACVPQLIGFLVLVGGCCGLSDVFGVVTQAQSHSDTSWV